VKHRWSVIFLALVACTAPNTEYSGVQVGPGGCSCLAGTVCYHNTCITGCVIDGTLRTSGAPDPTSPCRICTPARDTTHWSAVATGTVCGGGSVCVAGTCNSNGGCDLDGAHWATGAPNPSNACQLCQPSVATTSWSNALDGTACSSDGRTCKAGVCTTPAVNNDVCVIDGVSYPRGTGQPGNACGVCDPSVSKAGWSDLPDGSVCPGGTCAAGTCRVPSNGGGGCSIGGMSVAAGAADPTAACGVCNPALSTTQYSAAADGTSCGDAFTPQICIGGVCGDGCVIGGVAYAAGQFNPADMCQVCGANFGVATDWTAACCTFGTNKYPVGAANPANPCQTCQDLGGLLAWKSVPDGVSCDTGAFCTLGNCKSGCWISNKFYGAGTVSGNSCLKCDPTKSTSSFQRVADGTICYDHAGNDVCYQGSCQIGCYISGHYYSVGSSNPSPPAGTCQFCYEGTSWTPGCAASQTCVNMKCQ
jgi:hypothetical protein